jgi:signal transduction histidine kinase
VLNQLPLRITLPLVAAGLAGLVLMLVVAFANIEVRRSARFAADERLSRVADRIAGLASTSAAQRRQMLTQAGRRPALVALLRDAPVDSAEVREALEALRAAGDSGLSIQVWDRSLRVVYDDLRADPDDAALLETYTPPRVPLDTVPGYGAFHDVGGQVQYYSTAPVFAGSELLGWIVQRRRIGNPRLADELEPLIGRDARVLFSFADDSVWISLRGDAVPARTRELPIDATVLVAGGKLVTARDVAGTPWNVLIEMSPSLSEVRPEVFLYRMLLFGALLVMAASVAAWLLGRRLTRPLTELVSASEAVARGDYSRRVTPTLGGDELIRLAASYNVMAAQVSRSHDALRARLAEARALAEELDTARIEADRAREAAQAGDRAKSEFLATMSHEIRTPINAVLGFCDLLELEHLDAAARRDYIDRSRRAARRLAALVDDVLDLAKVDAGEVRIQTEMRRVRDAVDGTLALLEEETTRKGLAVECVVDPDACYAGDPHRVEQILVNLVSNAVKFTPEGGRIEVRAGAAADDAACIRVEVEDSGIGIAAEELDRIFEPFVQGHTGYTRKYGGTGLGLSISRRLARLMNGEIVVRSEPGIGSTFTLLLPAAAPAGSLAR